MGITELFPVFQGNHNNIPKSISLIDTNSDVDKQLSGVIENFDTNENNVLQEDLPLENDLDKETLD